MRLSKNFNLSEFTKSNTASRLGLSNIPTSDHVVNLKRLCDNILQPLRNGLGHSICVSSGYRGEQLNEAIGGSKTSDHCFGKAVDIDNDRFNELDDSRAFDNTAIFHYVKHNFSFDQLIWEFGNNIRPAWVHVSYRSKEKNRNQVLVAYKDDNNNTQYKIYSDGNI